MSNTKQADSEIHERSLLNFLVNPLRKKLLSHSSKTLNSMVKISTTSSSARAPTATALRRFDQDPSVETASTTAPPPNSGFRNS